MELKEIKLTGMRGFEAHSLWEVEQILQRLGIEWKRAIEMVYDRWSDVLGRRYERGIHVYFMIDEDTEVAYWTPIMHSLAILDTPRKWSQEFLAKTEIVKELD